MALKIDLYVPSGTITFEVGVSDVTNIVVHYYFANVVDVKIYFTDGSQQRFYQVACRLYLPIP